MNLVVHQLLSFRNPSWQVGNHLGESVKGKKYLDFEPEIQKGILLHRFIDSYSDLDPVVKRSTFQLHQNYGKFSPIIIDVYYDFLLIKNWKRFTLQPFEEFKQECYALLSSRYDIYPEKLIRFTEAMIMYDWYEAYSHYEGLESILQNMGRRTKFQNNMHMAVKDLYINEQQFEEDFLTFFPDLIKKTRQFLQIEETPYI